MNIVLYNKRNKDIDNISRSIFEPIGQIYIKTDVHKLIEHEIEHYSYRPGDRIFEDYFTMPHSTLNFQQHYYPNYNNGGMLQVNPGAAYASLPSATFHFTLTSHYFINASKLCVIGYDYKWGTFNQDTRLKIQSTIRDKIYRKFS